MALAQALDVDPTHFLTASFTLDGGRKDLDLIVAAARGSGVPTEVLDALAEVYGRASGDGHGSDDLAAVIHGFS